MKVSVFIWISQLPVNDQLRIYIVFNNFMTLSVSIIYKYPTNFNIRVSLNHLALKTKPKLKIKAVGVILFHISEAL